jgi:diguanylate cyclase (GGDEF)-like protein
MSTQFTVLIADDEMDKRQLLEIAFQVAGYEVLTAQDGAEALMIVESHAVDLIVTDVTMPKMDGFELARRVRANPRTRFIPIIIQSAQGARDDDVRRVAEAGALGYVTDPTDLDLLLARARTLLDFKSYLDKTQEAAFTDELTGIGNRRLFKTRLEREVTRAQRYNNPFCLCLFEVDNFARINSVYGPAAGEEVLCSVADVITAGTRGIDTSARLEQALFAIALPETDYSHALEVAERLSAVIERTPVSGVSEPIVASFGIAAFPTGAQDAAGLQEAARQSLVEAQRPLQATFEKAVKWVKRFAAASEGQRKPPSCFISYAWSTPENDDWVASLAKDLNDAGIETVLDQRNNAAIGLSIARFISRIETSDFIIVLGTPLYKEKYLNSVSTRGSVAAAEMDLIHERLLGLENEKNTVLPLILEGDQKSALPALMRGRVCGSFQDAVKYSESLFDLILTIYGIPFDHPKAESYRKLLRIRA